MANAAREFEEDAFGRTLYGALMDVQYGIHFNSMNEIFHRRVDRFLTFITLFSAVGVVVNLLKELPSWVNVAAALIITFASVIQALWNPAEKAGEFKLACSDFTRLESFVRELRIEEAYRQLAEVRARAPQGIGLLSQPAYNCMLAAAGFETTVELTKPERLAAAIV